MIFALHCKCSPKIVMCETLLSSDNFNNNLLQRVVYKKHFLNKWKFCVALKNFEHNCTDEWHQVWCNCRLILECWIRTRRKKVLYVFFILSGACRPWALWNVVGGEKSVRKLLKNLFLCFNDNKNSTRVSKNDRMLIWGILLTLICLQEQQ